MAFDTDATAEIHKLSAQLTAMQAQLTSALVQMAEMRGEQGGMRRDIERVERILNELSKPAPAPAVSLPPLPFTGLQAWLWLFTLLAIVGSVAYVIYLGGRAGG